MVKSAQTNESGLPAPLPAADGERAQVQRWNRLIIGWCLAAIAFVYAVSGLMGLPLYGDGAYYFFKLVLDQAPEVPNLRLAAVLPQLPALAALRLTDDVTLLRHAFSLGYAALPVLSLIACWLAVRQLAPVLILFPALTLVVNQVNFSAVSELLASLYLTWPFVLAAVLYPRSRCLWAFGVLLSLVLPLLHPLTFVLSFLLAGTAALNAALWPPVRRVWTWLGAALAASGVLRLGWTLLGANAYERSHAAPADAAHYLLPETPTQALLLLMTLVLGLALAVTATRRKGAVGEKWSLVDAGFLLLPAIGALIAAEILKGEGIQLKAGIVYPASALLMGLAVSLALDSVKGERFTRSHPRWTRYFLSCCLTVVLLLSAKSAAWWTGTRVLINTTASTEVPCIRFGPQEPYALQWPWMTVLDNWTAPLNALVFRGPWPISLLLPGDGCAVLARTGVARLGHWIRRPESRLESRFGPLRHADRFPDPASTILE